MKRSFYKKLGLYFSLAVIFLTLISLGWVEYQLQRMRGSFVPKVNPNQFETQTGPLAITNISVLSSDGASMIPGQTVLVANQKIVDIAPAAVIPHDATILDGSGKFLIPGLVDSHVHFKNSPNDLLLFLANGVTSIRDMGGKDTRLALRKKVEEGQLGPHMFLTSAKVHSKRGFSAWFSGWTRSRIHVADPKSADAQAKKLKQQGYDGIKISSFTDPQVYLALAAAGRDNGLPVTGHIPNQVSLDQVWPSGQTEVAHVEEFLKALNREFGNFYAKDHDEFLAFLTKRGPEIANKLKEHQIAVTTTHWIISSLPKQKFEIDPLVKSVALAYANTNLIEGTKLGRGWLPGNNSYEPSPDALEDPEYRAKLEKFWETYVKGNDLLTEIFIREGVTLMAGTDANTPLVIPGFSLHDELESLTRVGFSPAAALRAATAIPQAWQGEKAGKLLPGFRADLVILDKNPLENISNTQSIYAVILRGEFIEKSQLQEMLRAVKTANDQSRNLAIDDMNRFVPYLLQ